MTTTASVADRSVPLDVPLTVELYVAAARRLGWSARILDPEFSYLWELDDGASPRRAIVGAKLPVNDAAATEIATDKYYQGVVLGTHGIRAPRSVRCLSPRRYGVGTYADRVGVEPGLAFAREHGFPLVVKPNALSHGIGVRRVDDEAELIDGVEALFPLDDVVLVQELVFGREFRFDLLDGELLVAYERGALAVTGDGRSTLRELLERTDRRFAAPSTRAERVHELEATKTFATLRRDGLTLDSVVPEGRTFDFSRGITNLNRCATSTRLDAIPAPWLAWCRRLGEVLHLRWFGVDLRVSSLDADPSDAVVLEINASPLVNQLALTVGKEAAVDIHVKVLEALKR
ncbi:MAG: hypothetical protein R3F34_19175 [Planctomycetota bacterium]